MAMSASVLILQRRMTHYRVDLFEALRRRLGQVAVRLHVVYGESSSEDRSRNDAAELTWGTRVQCDHLWKGSRATYMRLPRPLLRQQALIILPHENSLLNTYPLLFKQQICRHRVAFWGHGANFQAQNQHSLAESIKAWSSLRAYWWFAYTRLSVQRIAGNGFSRERITCLNNAIDTHALVEWRKSIMPDEINRLRTALGISGFKTGIFIGSLHAHRKLEFLLSAVDEMRRRFSDFEFIVIGDGPLRGLVERFCASRDWCKWVGAKHGREKILHMMLGRVTLNPGMVGLNVLDCFAAEVPMVTSDSILHSPEIAYIDSGENGLIAIDGLRGFVDGASSVVTDDELHARLVRGCAASAEKYTLEQMVENFCGGIVNALQADIPLISA